MWIGDLTLRLRNWIAEVAQDGPFGNHATLTDGLVSYWALDELSGTRYDSVTATGNDLTDNNTVAYAVVGPRGTSASFVTGNTESLTIDPGPAPTELSVSMWVNLSACAAGDQYGQVLALKDGLFFIAAGKQDTGTVFFCVEEYSSAWYETFTTKGWTASANNTGWNHVLVEVSDLAHTITIYVNGALWVGPVAYSNPWGTGVTETLMAIGPKGFQYTGSTIGPATAGFNPKIDNVGIWGRTLTAGERTALYNSGVGKSYADLTADELVSLVSYWNLDEASGARYDSHGANDLTDNNTVGSINTGPVGVVAKFVEGSSEYLSRANASLVDWPQGDFHIAFWALRTGTDADAENNYISKLTSAGDQREWRVHTVTAQDRVYFNATTSDGTDEAVTNNTGAGSFPINTWNFVEFRRSGNEYGLAINGGTMQTASGTGVFNSTAALAVGARNSGSFGYHDGQMGRVGVWSRVLTADERASIRNSGVGKSYADLTAGELTGLVSYWDLTETSGTRSDSHGTNHLTDNNTVTYAINRPGFGVAASFVNANTEWLSRASSPLSAAGSWTVNMWVRRQILANYHGVFSMWNETFRIYSNPSADQWVGEFAGTPRTIAGTGDNTWVMLTATHDGSDDAYSWAVNNAGTLVGTANPVDSVDNFAVGSTVGGTNPHQGLIANVGLWNRVLTSQERADLFNAGKGLFYGD